MSSKSSPKKSGGALEIKQKKPYWKFWYGGCAVQQVYIVLSAIVGVLLGAYLILIATMKIHQTGYNENDQIIILFNKYKWQVISYLVLSFIFSLVINNLILVQYCNLGMKGGKNLAFSLLIFFFVLPTVNGIVSYILGYLMLSKMIEEARFMNLIK